jgi:hypothetical protein
MRGLFLLTLAAVLGLLAFVSPRREQPWWRGNTHTHTLWSDGDAAPEHAADVYKKAGYNFLVISDHNIQLSGDKWVNVGSKKGEVSEAHLRDLAARFGAGAVELRSEGRQMRLRTFEDLRPRFEDARFIFIQGEEITDTVNKLPLHHNSMNHGHHIPPAGGASMREAMAKTVEAVEAAAKAAGKPMLVHLNHPNFHWAVSPDDVAHVLGERYFEIYNGHRGVRNYGDDAHLGTEAIWDYVLKLRLSKLGGDVLYALATDDAHHYHKRPDVANMGRGWIWVRSPSLSPDAIVRAMQAGGFYASSGVKLSDVYAGRNYLTVRIEAEPGVAYQTRFIGARRGGEGGTEIMAVTSGALATYDFKGDELYVRAVVISSRRHPNGYDPEDLESAWVQPVRITN